MMTAPSVSPTTQRPQYVYSPDAHDLHVAAVKLLQSSGYTALRRLRCEVTEGVVIVHGVVTSYYLKQMVQTIVQRLDDIQGVMNLVEVRVSDDVLAEAEDDARAES